MRERVMREKKNFALLRTQVKPGRTSKSFSHAHTHIHAFPSRPCAHTPPAFLHNALALRRVGGLK